MHTRNRSRILALACLLTLPATASAQGVPRPAGSTLWSEGSRRVDGEATPESLRLPPTRERGFAVGAVIGGLAAGFLGQRMCRAYSALGDCWGTAAWWGVIGGMLGGAMGASAADEGEQSPDN